MKISLRRRHALTVADGAFSHKIDYVTVLLKILNPEEHLNRVTGSKVTEILLNGWILPICGASSGRDCACSLRSRLVLGESKSQWIYCEICDYKCNKINTIKKHMRTKHSHCISCDECGNLFSTAYSLDIQKGKDHKEIENESVQSFVFSESMLDEFL